MQTDSNSTEVKPEVGNNIDAGLDQEMGTDEGLVEPLDASELYSDKEEAGLDSLPSRTTQSLSEPVVRTHGAAEMNDSTFYTGHAIASALLILGVLLIFLAKGPRKRDALPSLLTEK